MPVTPGMTQPETKNHRNSFAKIIPIIQLLLHKLNLSPNIQTTLCNNYCILIQDIDFINLFSLYLFNVAIAYIYYSWYLDV